MWLITRSVYMMRLNSFEDRCTNFRAFLNICSSFRVWYFKMNSINFLVDITGTDTQTDKWVTLQTNGWITVYKPVERGRCIFLWIEIYKCLQLKKNISFENASIVNFDLKEEQILFDWNKRRRSWRAEYRIITNDIKPLLQQ